MWIVFLRGVNVGGRHRVPMDELRQLCAQLGFHNVRTYIQSGNIVLASQRRDAGAFAAEIEDAMEGAFGMRVAAILRTPAELRAVVEANPFPGEAHDAPSNLAVLFLKHPPQSATQAALDASGSTGEQLRLVGRELYTYYPVGMGKSKLHMPTLDRALRSADGVVQVGTARNWNTVLKVLAMAEGG